MHELGGRSPQPQVDAPQDELLVQRRDHLRVGRAHHLIGHFQQRNFQAAIAKRLDHFQTDVPAADDDGPGGLLFGKQLVNGVHVGHIS